MTTSAAAARKDRETFREIRARVQNPDHPLATVARLRRASESAGSTQVGFAPFRILVVAWILLVGSGTRFYLEFRSASAKPKILPARQSRGIASAGTSSPARQVAAG